MSEKEHLNCQQAKNQLDDLIESMVEARLKEDAPGLESSFEPTGPLKDHLADCHDCHNYQLANRVIIEAARALPRLQGDEALTESILAAIDFSQPELATAVGAPHEKVAHENPVIRTTSSTPSLLTWNSAGVLAVSFLAFTLTTSIAGGFNSDTIWSTGSWTLALLMVAMLKPLIEGNIKLANSNQSMAKA